VERRVVLAVQFFTLLVEALGLCLTEIVTRPNRQRIVLDSTQTMGENGVVTNSG
jgi:hypothetical protein